MTGMDFSSIADSRSIGGKHTDYIDKLFAKWERAINPMAAVACAIDQPFNMWAHKYHPGEYIVNNSEFLKLLEGRGGIDMKYRHFQNQDGEFSGNRNMEQGYEWGG